MSFSIDVLLTAPASEANSEALWAWVAGLSERHAQGQLTETEAAKAPLALKKVAEGGFPEAWLDLAAWHTAPLVGEPDAAAAEAALQAAMQAEVPTAGLRWVQFGWTHLRSSLSASQQRQRWDHLNALLALDPQHAEALNLLGCLTTAGFGTTADPVAGLAYQVQAAELLNADAMFEIANHHFRGLGVAVDAQAGLKATRQAAEHGHVLAMRTLGDFYAQGRFVARDVAQAMVWYARAAEAFDAPSCVSLATHLALGEGCALDRELAARYLDQAEALGVSVDALRGQLLR